MFTQQNFHNLWFRISFLCLLILFSLSCPLNAQETDSSFTKPNRLKGLAIGSAVAYSGMWVGLYTSWYAHQPRTSFHFFNDNRQWMLTDKAGHAYTAFHLSRTASEALQWAVLPPRKAVFYGSLSGWLLMVPIEIMDGFAADYGASWGDLAANAAGSLLYGSQIFIWEEARIKPKFSFHRTSFAPARPNVLGDNFPSQILKDYNGQTYWLSVDIDKFLPRDSKFPHWLNLGIGYGTEGMLFAHPTANREAGFNPYPQFYIAPDIDLSRIRTRNKFVKTLLFVLDGIHLPSPALELNKNRIRFHPVYF